MSIGRRNSALVMGVKGLIEIRYDNKLDNVMELEYS